MSAPSETAGQASLWKRLRASPMRDLIRGRVTGRLDLDMHARRADLPENLTELVIRVTKRTRLRALEKADVARELAAHFADGLAGGADAESLRKRFGDPTEAAKLIRRAKKRNRSRVLRAAKRATLGAFAVLAVSYVGVLIWYVAGSGEMNTSHDYLAELNAAASSVPDEDRAWPAYRSALLELGPIPWDTAECWMPEDPCWGDVSEYLAVQQPNIEAIRRAAAMPGMGFVAGTEYHPDDIPLFNPDPDPDAPPIELDMSLAIPSLGALLPHVGSMRQISRLLRYDAIWRHDRGESAAAIDDIDAMLGIAGQLRENETLIAQLVAISMMSLAIDTAQTMLDKDPDALTGNELTTLAQHFRIERTTPLHDISFRAERLMLRDVEQHSFTDDGAGDGRIRPEMLVYFASDPSVPLVPSTVVISAPVSLAMPSRSAFRMHADAFFAAANDLKDTPMWERAGGAFEDLLNDAERTAWSRLRWSYLLMFIPAFDRVITVGDRARLQADAMRTVIALHRFRLDRGRWPDGLDSLVPVYLGEVPIDRFDGQPLRYRLDDPGEPVLYSVGANRLDDGGVPNLDEDGWPDNKAGQWRPLSNGEQDNPNQSGQNEKDEIIPGDFILWPPLPVKPIEPPAGIHDP